ncbi:hypothetical protein Dimus_026529, partial [Dionaea muscipula]
THTHARYLITIIDGHPPTTIAHAGNHWSSNHAENHHSHADHHYDYDQLSTTTSDNPTRRQTPRLRPTERRRPESRRPGLNHPSTAAEVSLCLISLLLGGKS